jgi:hypothetical protein
MIIIRIYKPIKATIFFLPANAREIREGKNGKIEESD